MRKIIISARVFVAIVLGFISFIFLFAYLIHLADFAFNDNDVIRKYQFSKLKSAAPLHTIIVGDSSTGNAIDAAYFSELLGADTKNLALTGGFGLGGNYNLIRHVLKHNHPKNVIIMSTLKMWPGGFSDQGYLDTLLELPLAPIPQVLPSQKDLAISNLKRIVNVRQIVWLAKHLWKRDSLKIVNDYLEQREQKFSNDLRQLTDNNAYLASDVHPENLELVRLIDNLCQENQVRCIYAHGPIYDLVFSHSRVAIQSINKMVSATVKYGIFVEKVFSYPQDHMGDSEDHITPAFKRAVTRDYFETFKPYLVK